MWHRDFKLFTRHSSPLGTLHRNHRPFPFPLVPHPSNDSGRNLVRFSCLWPLATPLLPFSPLSGQGSPSAVHRALSPILWAGSSGVSSCPHRSTAFRHKAGHATLAFRPHPVRRSWTRRSPYGGSDTSVAADFFVCQRSNGSLSGARLPRGLTGVSGPSESRVHGTRR